MNHIYKIVWNEARQCYMVVCEYAKSQTKGCSGKKLLAMLVAAGVLASGVSMGGMSTSFAAEPVTATTVTATEKVTIGETTNVAKPATLLEVHGKTIIGDPTSPSKKALLEVYGYETLSGTLTIGDKNSPAANTSLLEVYGKSTLMGDVTIGKTGVDANGKTNNRNLTVNGKSTLMGNVAIGSASEAKSLTVYGTEKLSGKLTIGDSKNPSTGTLLEIYGNEYLHGYINADKIVTNIISINKDTPNTATGGMIVGAYGSSISGNANEGSYNYIFGGYSNRIDSKNSYANLNTIINGSNNIINQSLSTIIGSDYVKMDRDKGEQADYSSAWHSTALGVCHGETGDTYGTLIGGKDIATGGRNATVIGSFGSANPYNSKGEISNKSDRDYYDDFTVKANGDFSAILGSSGSKLVTVPVGEVTVENGKIYKDGVLVEGSVGITNDGEKNSSGYVTYEKFGGYVYADGDYAHIIGAEADNEHTVNAKGNYSTVMGVKADTQDVATYGDYSTIIGSNNSVAGAKTGDGDTAVYSGAYATVIGSENVTASGDHSTVIGSKSTSKTVKASTTAKNGSVTTYTVDADGNLVYEVKNANGVTSRKYAVATDGTFTDNGDGTFTYGQSMASGKFSTVVGSEGSAATGNYSGVYGGTGNYAAGTYDIVLGGNKNIADSGAGTTVGNGVGKGVAAAVVGGWGNQVYADSSAIIAGNENTISKVGASRDGAGEDSAILAGAYNVIAENTDEGAIIAGKANTLNAWDAVIVGGAANYINGDADGTKIGSTITGGYRNTIDNVSFSSIVGGGLNTIKDNGNYAFIAGGVSNVASGQMSSVIGSYKSTAAGPVSSVIASSEATTKSAYTAIIASDPVTINENSEFSVISGSKGTEDAPTSITGQFGYISNSDGATITANHGTIIGSSNSTVTGDYGVVIGGNNSSAIAESVALGTGAVANTEAGKIGYDLLLNGPSTETSATWKSTANAISVGDAANDVTRQITGVAAGTEDTDAVNVAQLKKAAAFAIDTATEAFNMNFVGDYDTDGKAENNINRKSGQTLNIVGNAAADAKLSDGNIAVVSNNTDTLTLKLASDVNIDTLVINGKDGKDGKDGITIKGADGKDGVGIDGKDGITVYGKDGKDGVSINGNDGISIKGEPGEDGKDGQTLVVIGKDGKDGKDGYIGVNGADGKTGIGLNGKDGSIGINGKDGASADITVKNGEPGVDGKDGEDGITRIVYKDPEGTDHEVATLDDGMKYTGDFGDGAAVKLNKIVNVVGNAESEDDLTDGNIGVVAEQDGENGKLTVKLNKDIDLTEDGSITIGGTTIKNKTINVGDTTINNDGMTIKNGPTVTKTKVDVAGNKITNVAAGTEDTDAVNVSQLKTYIDTVEKTVVTGSERIDVTSEKDEETNTTTYNVVLNKYVDVDGGYDNKEDSSDPDKHGWTMTQTEIKDGEKTQVTYADTTLVGGDVYANGDENYTLDKEYQGSDYTFTDTAGNKVTLKDIISGNDLAKYLTDIDTTNNEAFTIDSFDAISGVEGVDSNKIAEVNEDGEVSLSIVQGDNVFKVGITNVATKTDITNIHNIIGDINNINENIGGDTLVENINNVYEESKKHTTVVQGDNITVTEGTNADGGKEYTVALNKDIHVDSVSINETNIKVDQDGIHAGDKKITNVAAGTEDTDAVNVSQLKELNQNIENNINKVGTRANKGVAGAAALAALHPMDFDPDDKLTFAAGVGNFHGETAAAIGAFYRPDEKVMFNIGGTVGNGENVVNAGVSFSLDRTARVTNTKTAMARDIIDLKEQVATLTNLVQQLTGGNGVARDMFPDVPENHWAYEYVKGLVDSGVLVAYPDGLFDGERPGTRYEFAAMLYRAMRSGVILPERIAKEFAPEIGRFRVDRIHGADDNNHKIERIRVNGDHNYGRDNYGSKNPQPVTSRGPQYPESERISK